jgi:hypothetical protein
MLCPGGSAGRADIRHLRVELKGDVAGLQSLIVRFGVSILICLVTVIAALIGVIPGDAMGA